MLANRSEIIDGKSLNGKKLAKRLDFELSEKVKFLRDKGIIPTLAVIMVGNHLPSLIYVSKKQEACLKLGIKSIVYKIEATMLWKEELFKKICDLNNDSLVHGILLQMPLPEIETSLEFLELIDPKKDVDGLTSSNVSKLFLGIEGLYPCTPLGCIALIKETNVKIQGSNVIVIGRSILVGKPLGVILLNMGATVTFAHSKTKDLNSIINQNDIVISAVGSPSLIKTVKKDSIVIDVGITRTLDGKIKGDVDFESVSKVASYITPVPGGVGPMTVHFLTSNLIKACMSQI